MKPLSMSMILLKFHLTIHMKATEHYFPVVLFIMLHKVILTSDFGDKMKATVLSLCCAKWF